MGRDEFAPVQQIAAAGRRIDGADLSQAVELKRPVFLAASKVDCADARGLNEFRKLCNSRKLKGSPFFHSVRAEILY
jgi:hypothetical protein